jgi:hypothetical protein
MRHAILHLLKNNAECILVAMHAFVLDDAGVRHALHQIDLSHQLSNLLFLETFKSDPLDGYHLAGVQIQGTVNRPELATANTVTQLLMRKHKDKHLAI